MVGHEVEQHPHAGCGDCGGQLFESHAPAQFLIDPAVIVDVVAVGASWRGLQDGREVERVHPKRGEERHQRVGVGEGKVLVKLQPVGVEGNAAGGSQGHKLWILGPIMNQAPMKIYE